MSAISRASAPGRWLAVASLLVLAGCRAAGEDGRDPLRLDDGIVTIGIYADEGAAQACVVAAEQMFLWMGHAVRRIYARDVNGLDVADIDVFYFPGGSSGPYLERISEAGKGRIREMVDAGCGYIGTCAGALFAARAQAWDGALIREGQLALYPGTGFGPLPEIYAYPLIGMTRVDLVRAHPITAPLGDSMSILFYNSPAFENGGDGEEGGGEVLGTYAANGRPAIVSCAYGKGRVFLIGPHPEWEEDDDRDHVSFFDEFADGESDWELMRRATDWCLGAIS